MVPILRSWASGVALLLIATVTLLADPAALLGQSSPAGRLVQVSARTWTWFAEDERTSNGALFVGEEGALVVDPGLTPSIARDFLRAAEEAAGKPVTHVVITHWHPDHALGVVCLGDRSFEVLAHPMTRRRLAEQGALQAKRLAGAAPDPAEAADFAACLIELPDQTVAERRVVDLGGHTVEIFHPGAAHTAGDLVVWSADERFLVTGDVFMHQASPSMGEGSAIVWVDVLNGFIDLAPDHVVAGHFGPSTRADLVRFRDYMAAQVERVGRALASGVTPEEVVSRVDFEDFDDFAQFPQYGATFDGNAEAVARELSNRPAGPGETNGFDVVARLDVGLNPHQIAFSADGGTAYVAVAGSDHVAIVDVATSRLVRAIAVEGTPLGVVLLPGGQEMAVTRFQKNEVARYALGDGAYLDGYSTGVGASLISGPLPDGRWLISVEQTDALLIMDPGAESAERVYSVGDRPFPPAATSDGRLAFVPGYDDGTVTVIDLWNDRVLDTVEVGANPSGGVVLPGDIEYAVAVRGEDRIAFINTASRRVVGSLSEGIGASPFSVVLSTNGRLAFVNNTASHDISVIALPEKRVIARIPIGEQPIVMGAHPSGETLFVSSEGNHELSIIRIPDRWLRQPQPSSAGISTVTEVAVMGMIHGRHRESDTWGLEQVKDAIRRFEPDVLCTEIAPDRWERIWSDFTERGVIEDSRVRVFPEYTDAILDLAVEMGFEIVPCAGWTQEMSDLRGARILEFNTTDEWATRREEYASRRAEVRRRIGDAPAAGDDPRFIHSDAYDQRQRAELDLYDEFQNDLIGPGGWTNINEAHYRLIDRAIEDHRGRRILITFGGGHKYWFLDRLRGRDDVTVLDLAPYLQ